MLDLIRIDSQSVEIRVSYGETIAHYANWLKTDAHSLYSLNKLNATAQLSLEQRILLPIDTKAVSRFNRQRLEFHMANEEDFFNQYTISSVKKHMVEANETMQSLCSGAIPLWLFKKLNKTLDTSDLKPGTVVQLPTIMAKTPTSEPTYFDQ